MLKFKPVEVLAGAAMIASVAMFASGAGAHSDQDAAKASPGSGVRGSVTQKGREAVVAPPSSTQSSASSSTCPDAAAVSSVGALSSSGGGAASASYARSGQAAAPSEGTPACPSSDAEERRRVEVLKSNKEGDPNAGRALTAPEGQTPAPPTSDHAINEKGTAGTRPR